MGLANPTYMQMSMYWLAMVLAALIAVCSHGCVCACAHTCVDFPVYEISLISDMHKHTHALPLQVTSALQGAQRCDARAIH